MAKFAKYGDKKMDLGDLSLDKAKEIMARFFPELAEPKIETKKEGEDTIYVFTKQAGRKGAGRNPVRRITARLAKLKPTTVVPQSATAYSSGQVPYIAIADQEFLRAEIRATQHASHELNALAPELNGEVLL